jgi:hypothetical protein
MDMKGNMKQIDGVSDQSKASREFERENRTEQSAKLRHLYQLLGEPERGSTGTDEVGVNPGISAELEPRRLSLDTFLKWPREFLSKWPLSTRP